MEADNHGITMFDKVFSLLQQVESLGVDVEQDRVCFHAAIGCFPSADYTSRLDSLHSGLKHHRFHQEKSENTKLDSGALAVVQKSGEHCAFNVDLLLTGSPLLF